MTDDFKRLEIAAREICGLEKSSQIARHLFGHDDSQRDQKLNNWKSRGIPRGEVLDVAKKLGCNPYWLRDGEGNMAADTDMSEFQIKSTETRDLQAEAIQLLADMDGDDADVWLVTAKAAANKARRKKLDARPPILPASK